MARAHPFWVAATGRVRGNRAESFGLRKATKRMSSIKERGTIGALMLRFLWSLLSFLRKYASSQNFARL